MARTEGRSAGHPDGAEMRDWPRAHWQSQRREARLVIDLDVLVADFRAGETRLAEHLRERQATGDHILCNHRVAGFHGERVAQPRCVLSGRFEAWQLDGFEAILRAGI